MNTLVIVISSILGLIILMAILYYNSFISFKNKVSDAWSSINVQLKRRYDMIPNLMESVKAYSSHEKEVFVKVTEARAMAINAGSVNDQSAAENMLSDALKSLFAVAENYPDLKASNNFIEFQDAIQEVEQEIQLSRRYYNAITRDANIAMQKFPGVVFAGIFGFKAYDFFEISEKQKENIQVKF